jgi:hypothetical protein
LEDNDANFRSLWQDTADHVFPRENTITTVTVPGFEKMERLYDTTGVDESINMTSGLMGAVVPAGQEFFSMSVAEEELQEIDGVASYLNKATKTMHVHLFRSNYLLMLAETLRSLIVFGTGNIFSDWNAKVGLNFMDWDISRYQVLENFEGRIDTNIIKFQKTAAQAVEKWGERAGKSVLEAYANDKKKNDKFWFIHVTRPRENRNPRLEDNLNMSWESIYIAVKDKHEIDEGGFPEFPFAIPRWTKTTGEVHGRGIGTRTLPQIRQLQVMKRDFNEMGNKLVNPHREVLESFEGDYNTAPGAKNEVLVIPSSYVDERNFGNFPVGKDTLELERQVVKDAFYHDAFAPITSAGPGDRRNELEIYQRVTEAFMRIGSPIGRLRSELLSPQIERVYLLLVRNGVIPKAPAQLARGTIKIIYRGPMAAALEDAEVRASRQWIGVLGEMSTVPGLESVVDNISPDSTARRMGRVYGVNEQDIATEEEVAAKRQARAEALQAQQALEVTQTAAAAYGQTTKAPEQGSAAEQLQEATV